jgi:hypothetical protein
MGVPVVNMELPIVDDANSVLWGGILLGVTAYGLMF